MDNHELSAERIAPPRNRIQLAGNEPMLVIVGVARQTIELGNHNGSLTPTDPTDEPGARADIETRPPATIEAHLMSPATLETQHAILILAHAHGEVVVQMLKNMVLHGAAGIDAGTDLRMDEIPRTPDLRRQVAAERSEVLTEVWMMTRRQPAIAVFGVRVTESRPRTPAFASAPGTSGMAAFDQEMMHVRAHDSGMEDEVEMGESVERWKDQRTEAVRPGHGACKADRFMVTRCGQTGLPTAVGIRTRKRFPFGRPLALPGLKLHRRGHFHSCACRAESAVVVAVKLVIYYYK